MLLWCDGRKIAIGRFVEREQAVLRWNRGPFAELNGGALGDPAAQTRAQKAAFPELVNLDELGVTKPSLEVGRRQRHLQLPEGRAPDVSCIQTDGPCMTRAQGPVDTR